MRHWEVVRSAIQDPEVHAQLSKRFWRKVTKIQNGCWEWTAHRSKRGYGSFGVFRGLVKSHRFALLISGVQVGVDDCVLHSCDNPSCCNPGHLRVGNQLDNASDRETRGRGNPPSGSRHGRYVCPERTARGVSIGTSKLTSEDVRRLRWGDLKDMNNVQAAKVVGVTNATVSKIRLGKTWAHVTQAHL